MKDHLQKKILHDAPLRIDGQYSVSDLRRLRHFMHGDFPHVSYGGGRYGKVIIEYPPAGIIDKPTWKHILDVVLAPELEALHPTYRHENIIIRFSDTLFDEEHKKSVGGVNDFEDGENWIRIKNRLANGNLLQVRTAVFNVMHELIERDYWRKTIPKKGEVKKEDALGVIRLSESQYRNLEDEKIANRRALRALQRMWPDVNYSDQTDIYEEDR